MTQNFGNAATRLLNGEMNVNSLRTNATLRKDEWKHYDKAVIEAAQERLTGVADLYSRGLIYRIPNGLGTTVLEYEDVSDMEAAEMNMAGITRGAKDRIEFDINYLPLPIIHKDFSINIRVLNASRTTGAPLDTTMAALAARKVADYQEQILFIGTGATAYTFGGGAIYGYMTAAARNTGTIGTTWSSDSGSSIIDDVLAMKQASIDDRHYGPWIMYIPTAYETTFDDDYTTGYPKSIRSRVLEVDGLQAIKVSDKLTATNVIMVQMTPDVVRMVEGLALTTVEWQTEGNMIFHFKVMTISVPQVRADQADRSGIQHWSV